MKIEKKKLVIFCGGKATRFNNGKPGPLKPLIKIGKKTILEKIISLYDQKFYDEIILLGGYKFNELKKFVKNKKNIKAINTGKNTPTGGRVLKIKKIIGKSEFFLTYGDSLLNYNAAEAIKEKKKSNFVMSAYKYQLDYGVLKLKKNELKKIFEKNFFIPINAGFYIFDYTIFNYIKSINESLEKDTIPRILKSKKKIKIIFFNNWFPMDNMIDKFKIENKYTHD